MVTQRQHGPKLSRAYFPRVDIVHIAQFCTLNFLVGQNLSPHQPRLSVGQLYALHLLVGHCSLKAAATLSGSYAQLVPTKAPRCEDFVAPFLPTTRLLKNRDGGIKVLSNRELKDTALALGFETPEGRCHVGLSVG